MPNIAVIKQTPVNVLNKPFMVLLPIYYPDFQNFRNFIKNVAFNIQNIIAFVQDGLGKSLAARPVSSMNLKFFRFEQFGSNEHCFFIESFNLKPFQNASVQY